MQTKRHLTRLIRQALSSLAATALDLVTLLSLTSLLHLYAGLAGALGNVAGGLLSFVLCRRWVFGAGAKGGGGSRLLRGQLVRYAVLVVGCGALLTGAAIQLATSALGLPLLAAKAVIGALVLVCWNCPIATRHVFAPTNEEVCHDSQ